MLLCRVIMKSTSQKESSIMSHYNLVHKYVPTPQAMKILDAKAAVDTQREKLEKLPARKVEKVKSKKEVILKAQQEQRTLHFDTLMDICHLKNSGDETKVSKFEGRGCTPR